MAFDPAIDVPEINPDTPYVAPANEGQSTYLQTYGHPMMLLAGLATGISDIVASNNQATALKTQAEYRTWAAGENIARAKMQTGQVQEETAAKIAAFGTRTNQRIGATRAGFGNQGVNVNSGTPLELQVQEGKLSAVDALTIRNNAALRAWGINTGANQTAAEQRMMASGERFQAKQSLLLGGAKAANDLMVQEDLYTSMNPRG